ncbi:MAG: hypothetical protein GWN18_10400, partial [Thermoplasmata archaeon]|nr:carboxypeptidase regulatory-like domain-containing protein [Thermoplasmata archaeon]NIS12458.1 carboxypeptidase regulatory-like domain-containing protein [Thermoplasmata archaeon]NIS20376.1 carboxypeptidase regulatory-like domain-containing protein [Thermoplasmata archaeon]NIT77722.1 carboxypeptidase regulatory-like domain-containing protein [Thermoplasmata archaeon]NIU49463.1 carboxypeptidase regulatory-like domain-containing protein [Thermoplasmata archaeon]
MIGERSPARIIVVVLGLLVLSAVILPLVPGLFVGSATVEGWVIGPGDAPVEAVRVEIVGMDEFNTTTDGDGHYVMVVPFLEVGHTLAFTHEEMQTRQVSTGPLVEDGLVLLNVTVQEKAPWATLTIQILPWDQPGSNYGLRQDVMTVESIPGT